MQADSRQTDTGVHLSAFLLGGLLPNALLGQRWADPVAALMRVPNIAREGMGRSGAKAAVTTGATKMKLIEQGS